MWRGWISALYRDKEHLESLGIKLGDYDYETLEFKNCILSNLALSRLDEFWGLKYIWGLKEASIFFEGYKPGYYFQVSDNL